MQNALTAALAWVALLSPTAAADDPQPGFVLSDLPYPGTLVTATLSGGEIVAFDGLHIDLYEADGDLIANLTTLPAFVYPSFLIVDPGESFLVFGESSQHGIYELGLSPDTPNPITTLLFNYDAVFEDENTLLVSAATCGIGCGNSIFRVDIPTGGTQLVCRAGGASGPIALDPQGNLYYGTATSAFPPPPNPSRILRWDAAQLTGSPVVSETEATVVASGLEGAIDLVYDPVGGSLYVASSNFGTGVNRLRQVLGPPGNDPILVEGAPFETIANLEFEPGDGIAQFLGYQPATGGVLRYNTTDFVSVFARRALTARRPSATVSGPGTTGPGMFAIGVENGPPNGRALVFYGPAALYDPAETVVHLGLPLFFGLDLPSAARAPGQILLDGAGQGSHDYFNPGGLEGLFAVQLLLIGPDQKIKGTSSAAFL